MSSSVILSEMAMRQDFRTQMFSLCCWAWLWLLGNQAEVGIREEFHLKG